MYIIGYSIGLPLALTLKLYYYIIHCSHKSNNMPTSDREADQNKLYLVCVSLGQFLYCDRTFNKQIVLQQYNMKPHLIYNN